MKRFFKDWFAFSKGEQRGIIFLAVLLLLLLLVPFVFDFFKPQHPTDADMEHLRELSKRLGEAAQPQYDALTITEADEKKNFQKFQTFKFDPNFISRDSLMLLGFSSKQADAITRYRERGSGFRSASDFLKLNVITDKQRERLQPYIAIVPVKKVRQRDTVQRTTFAERQAVELNTADTALLRTLPGIGTYYAQRIVEHREALGGYANVEQLLEIKNFGSERLERLTNRVTLDQSTIFTFELSEENADFMRRHPYIGAYAARGIVQLAKRKGAPATLDELVANNIISPQQAEKLKPYVR